MYHFPERDTTKTAEQQGLFNKFNVTRVDGSSAPFEKHENCSYFVIDLDHDPHAKAACLAYAASCVDELPQLSLDLRAEAYRLPTDMKAVRNRLIDAAVKAAYNYFCSCDVGPERVAAGEIYDNLRNAGRVY